MSFLSSPPVLFYHHYYRFHLSCFSPTQLVLPRLLECALLRFAEYGRWEGLYGYLVLGLACGNLSGATAASTACIRIPLSDSLCHQLPNVSRLQLSHRRPYLQAPNIWKRSTKATDLQIHGP
jgi:hypothetical protein